jgi:hypothetical protein
MNLVSIHSAPALPLPLRGERVGVRGAIRESHPMLCLAEIQRPSPQPSPRKDGEREGKRYAKDHPLSRVMTAEHVASAGTLIHP